MKNVTLCGGSGTRSRFRLGSPKYRAVPVVKIGKCANGWNRRISPIPVRPDAGLLIEPTPASQPCPGERVFVPLAVIGRRQSSRFAGGISRIVRRHIHVESRSASRKSLTLSTVDHHYAGREGDDMAILTRRSML